MTPPQVTNAQKAADTPGPTDDADQEVGVTERPDTEDTAQDVDQKSRDEQASSNDGTSTTVEPIESTDEPTGARSGATPSRVGRLVNTWPRRLVGLLIVALIAAVVVLGILFRQESAEVAQMRSAASEESRAQEVALAYATKAATMSYTDLEAWKENLTAGTTPELTKKLTDASTSMEQIIVPLQWTSTAEGLGAIVRSEKDGDYVVVAFVSVDTKNAQAPDGVKSTATYTVTMDRDADWIITDVGGVETAVGG